MEAGWVPWAHLILGLIALYLLVTPFVIAFRFRKTENRNTENNFEHLALLMAVAALQQSQGSHSCWLRLAVVQCPRCMRGRLCPWPPRCFGLGNIAAY